MKQAYDINPSVGGPLMRDKLWFYTSARWQTNQNYIAGLYDNANAGDPTKWLYAAGHEPTRGVLLVDAERHQPAPHVAGCAQKHKLSFYYDNQTRVWDDSRAGVSPESTVAYRFPVLNLAQAGWTSPMTSRLLLEARYANRGEAFGNQLPGSRRRVSRDDPGDSSSRRTSVSGQGRRRRRQRHSSVSPTRTINTRRRLDVVRHRRALVQGRLQRHVGDYAEHVETRTRRTCCSTASTTASRTSSRMYGDADARRVAGQGRDRPLRAGSLDASTGWTAQRWRPLRPVHRRLPGAAPAARSSTSRRATTRSRRSPASTSTTSRRGSARPTICSATARRRSRSVLGKYMLTAVARSATRPVSAHTTTRTWNDFLYPAAIRGAATSIRTATC